jgi:microcystin-dependent protein
LNPINGNARNGVYYVKGTQTASTGAWTGNIPVPALYDGLTIMYYLPYAGSGNATLNLTLSNGTTTGAKNCYYSTSRLTTHYAKGCNIVMTYHPAGTISVDGTATTDDRWIANADYNTNSNTWRNVKVNGTELLGTGTGTGALNLKSGTNTTVSGSGNDVTISATDTNTIAGMTDVRLTSPTDNDLLVYDSNLSGGKTWKNAKKIVTCTKAQFDAWSANNSFPYTDCKYIVTDVNNLNTTSADIPYDSTGTDSVKDVLDLLLDRIYPVGSIYISVTDSTVEAVQAKFGGTWVRFGAGRTLVGYDSTQTEFDTVEDQGGEKNHTLVPQEMPSRMIVQVRNTTSAAKTASAINATWGPITVAANEIRASSIYDAGTNGIVVYGQSETTTGGGSHNNLQPYITVYMYKRTA